jgi:CBS-domain-containing membrane protein
MNSRFQDKLSNYINKFRGGKRVPPRAPGHEILISFIGAFLGIFAVYEIGHFDHFHIEETLFLVGSFGASAVLLYGLPKSPYAQPRNLILGHLISAIIGVTCALLLSAYPAVSAALAVSLAVFFMHITKSLHPPGGATALIAVIGSEHIHQMGYWYVFTPVLSGSMILLVVALLVNNLSPNRRYPEYWF